MSAHQAGAGARPFPRRSGANGRPQCLDGRREAEDYRDEPWTQWCFRAESSRTSQAHSIPSPTVTAGTQFSPFKHIICARMAVKHHTLRSFTHSVPWYCCVCRLSIIEPLKDLDGEPFLSIWYLDQLQGNKIARDNRFLAYFETDHFGVTGVIQKSRRYIYIYIHINRYMKTHPHIHALCFVVWQPP